LLVAKLDRLSRSVAFIATLMDSKGFDLAIADIPRANRLTLHVLAAAGEHERHMIGERTQHALAVAKGRGIKLGNTEQAKINRARAAERAQALRPHLERSIKAGRISSSARPDSFLRGRLGLMAVLTDRHRVDNLPIRIDAKRTLPLGKPVESYATGFSLLWFFGCSVPIIDP
jgi:hypothetical protein